MLLVVLGAGASFDSNPALSVATERGHPARPPLADDLFSPRRKFIDAIGMFPKLRPIAPRLSQRHGKGVEEVLRVLRDEASEHEERLVQLMATRFYLQRIIWQCTEEWKGAAAGATCYATLVDLVQCWIRPPQQVTYVTFNYDTLLEQAMSDLRRWVFQHPDSYIAPTDCHIIKPHGSVNWVRRVQVAIDGIGALGDERVVHELIDKAASVVHTDELRVARQLPSPRFRDGAYVPAIAIPMTGKSDFECPEAHLAKLQARLPDIRGLLVIGWRAQEQRFLQLLCTGLQTGIRCHIVSGSTEDAEATRTSIAAAGVSVSSTTAGKGFSHFVTSDDAAAFLREVAALKG